MSSANEDLAAGRVRYYGVEHGLVIDNEDPEGLYRVRAEVPGLIEKTPWMFPIGTQGGGAPQRGAWTVPDVGASVAIFFIGGDVERPVYMCGWWKTPDAGSQMPSEAKAVPLTEVHKVQTVHESKRVRIWVDERDDKEQLSIQDKTNEDVFIQVDLKNGVVKISALAALQLEAVGRVEIKGAEVIIQERLVLPDSKPIA